MTRRTWLVMPLALTSPLVLLVLGLGTSSIDSVRAACVTGAHSGVGGAFRVGTLNWRGASHYVTNPHPDERPYVERMPHMLGAIEASAASIVGFQEFEAPQARAFLDATNGAWQLVNGRRHGEPSTADAIAYRPAAWTVDEVRYVSIRYGGATIQVPLVRFTSTGNGGSVWVLNSHHPADAVGGSAAMRDAAVRTESLVLQDLHDAEPETPALLTGDMNDGRRFKQLFLALMDGWRPANPDDAQIDWILGSPALSFSGTVVDHSTNDGAHRYTDHPFVHTTARQATATPEPTQATASPTAGPTAAPVTATEQVAPPRGPVRPTRDPTTSPPGPLASELRNCLPCPSSTTASSTSPEADGTAPAETGPPGCTGSTLALVTELPADLQARIDAMLKAATGLCGLSWTIGAPCTYDNQCPKVIDALYGGTGVGRGYGNGADVAQGVIEAGLAQSHGTGLDPLPPVGAVVSYDTGDRFGHVALYVGEGRIFGNDYGCSANGVFGCVGFTDIRTPGGSVTWALPSDAFDLGGMPRAAA